MCGCVDSGDGHVIDVRRAFVGAALGVSHRDAWLQLTVLGWQPRRNHDGIIRSGKSPGRSTKVDERLKVAHQPSGQTSADKLARSRPRKEESFGHIWVRAIVTEDNDSGCVKVASGISDALERVVLLCHSKNRLTVDECALDMREQFVKSSLARSRSHDRTTLPG